MSDLKNRQILLVARPEGEPKLSDFQLVESDVPTPGEGEVLCQTIYLSLDPYMRGRMNEAKNYAKPVELGTVMEGGCVGKVIASNDSEFAEGDIVEGKVFETVLPLFNPFARIPVCGTIAIANDTGLPPGPNQMHYMLRQILTKRLTFRGFIVSDYADQREEAFSTLGGWIREDKLRYKEDIVDGLENAPAALIGLLKGENFGKLIIRVSDDPTNSSHLFS